MQKNYNAGIYCQLSREDERSGKLVSVENQKIMLERYVHTGVDPLARDRELDMLFERLYEDNVSGKIDDARFAKMSKRYEQEQGENAGRIKALRLELKKLEDKRMDVDTFLGNGAPLHRRHHSSPSAWLPSSFSTSRFIRRSRRTALPISG